MKPLLLLAVLPLILAVFAVPAAAGAPSAPHVATGVEPTELHPAAPADIDLGGNAIVTAILHDARTEIGLGSENVTFSLRATFGWLLLKETTTDSQGKAYLDYDAVAPGNFTIQVAFSGDTFYAPSNATVALSVVAGPLAPVPWLPTTGGIVLVILAVVGGVWATYGFVAWQVLGIQADRPEAEKEDRRSRSASEVKRSMEDEANSPKRVSGSANAGSRATLIVAIAALVLAGVGVGLAGLSALAPKPAAYTPGTVELQVAIVPDIQGGGWDVFLPNDLVVHKGDTVKFTVINADEMDHGFAISAFGVDVHIDPATNVSGEVVPNLVHIPSFVPDQVGQFLIKCDVVCGDGHDNMIGTLMVLPD